MFESRHSGYFIVCRKGLQHCVSRESWIVSVPLFCVEQLHLIFKPPILSSDEAKLSSGGPPEQATALLDTIIASKRLKCVWDLSLSMTHLLVSMLCFASSCCQRFGALWSSHCEDSASCVGIIRTSASSSFATHAKNPVWSARFYSWCCAVRCRCFVDSKTS